MDIVVGSQWGDEGKGKLVDIVSKNYDICARVAGGSNAGHTIVVNVSAHLEPEHLSRKLVQPIYSFSAVYCPLRWPFIL